jgi:hypothetical protein
MACLQGLLLLVSTDRSIGQCSTYREVRKAGHVLLQHAPLEGRHGRLAIIS